VQEEADVVMKGSTTRQGNLLGRRGEDGRGEELNKKSRALTRIKAQRS
jgi:hypothetical protein